MAKLAIKGHSTRGNEVIKILEMLGGNNFRSYSCDEVSLCYYIDNDEYDGKVISLKKEPTDSIVFTLEEFLEKYPYKFGDKVTSTNYKGVWEIVDIFWNEKCGFLYYGINNGKKKELVCVDVLQPYKEEAMKKEISGAIVDRFICLEGYDFYDDKGNIIDTKEIIMKKKKPKYPKTFVECAKILDCFCAAHIDGYKCELLENLQELLICRDAYWKIAGDWKPDFNNGEEKFVIANYYGKLCTAISLSRNRVLVFPNEEMRDAFYENFKELIEECKELL